MNLYLIFLGSGVFALQLKLIYISLNAGVDLQIEQRGVEHAYNAFMSKRPAGAQ